MEAVVEVDGAVRIEAAEVGEHLIWRGLGREGEREEHAGVAEQVCQRRVAKDETGVASLDGHRWAQGHERNMMVVRCQSSVRLEPSRRA